MRIDNILFGNDYDARIGNRVAAFAIAGQVESNLGPSRNDDSLINDRVLQTGAAANLHIIEQNARLDVGVAVNPRIRANHTAFHKPA